MRILVVDDEKIKRVTLADDLTGEGHEVVTAGDGQQAADLLDREVFDVLITDLKMPRIDGMELLKRLKATPDHDDVAVILMTAYGSIPMAVEAMKQGAFDFVTKPFRNEEVFPLIRRIEAQRREDDGPTLQTVESSPADELDRQVIGDSQAMKQVKRMIKIAARTDANVLLSGETGVGKDLIAAVIHRHSHRHKAPFIKTGCTLFPSTLIESELYGHQEGSFTGADQSRKGRFELAEGGTIYLDDVDDIPLEHQAKLLRAIEEKIFERVGGNKLIHADVRIIASTKLNLLDQIADGAFRQDLYYRLDVLRIRVPALRERPEDIPALTGHLLHRIARGQDYRIDDDAIVQLTQHDWPGNVRELVNTLERALLVSGGHITREVLQSEASGVTSFQPGLRPGIAEAATARVTVDSGGFKAAMEFAEKQLLVSALEACGGNKSAAANSLGMKASTFRDKLSKHGLK